MEKTIENLKEIIDPQENLTMPEYLIYIKYYVDEAMEAIAKEEMVSMCTTPKACISKIAALAISCSEKYGVCKQ
jgi:hypothetical protein